DGEAHLMKTDILRGIMWFSYDPHSMANMKLLTAKEVKEIILLNKKGIKSPSLFEEALNKSPEFLSAVGEDSISRFDVEKNKKRTNTNRQPRDNNKKRWDNKDNKDKSSDVKDI
ncbi:MAG: hypothetical protein RR770_02650, partial [Bacteroidales bacterium]